MFLGVAQKFSVLFVGVCDMINNVVRKKQNDRSISSRIIKFIKLSFYIICYIYFSLLVYWPPLILFSSFPLLARSNEIWSSSEWSTLNTWSPSPFPHLVPPSKQNLSPSTEPYRLEKNLWNQLYSIHFSIFHFKNIKVTFLG